MRLLSHIDAFVPLLNDPADLSSLEDEPSWNRIKEHAGSYGVAALVAYAARSHVSPTERSWCDRILVENWVRHERVLGQLEYVLGLLADEGIPAIALKGPLLAQRYYEPAFLRKPSMDLDLAVVEQDLAGACNALIKAGYEQDFEIGEAAACNHHVTLSHRSRPRVELHFRLSHQTLGIPVKEFFERTVSCRLPSGREARILGPADQLLHLVLHFAHSRFGTLFNFYEIRRAFRAEAPGVRAEALRSAVDHHFCGALRMTDVAFRTRLGEPFLPPELVVPPTWLNWRLNEKLYRAFERWSMPDRELTPAARLWGRWLDFQITDGPSEALRSMKLLAQTARFGIARRDWRKSKNLAYGPRYSAP
jgi:Uncharacterised nucleotidyltransferase